MIITTTASQVPELLCQSTDWINRKFDEVCGNLKWFSPVKSQYVLSQCQHVPPYIRFEGDAEFCSRLWLVVAVWQRDKRKPQSRFPSCEISALLGTGSPTYLPHPSGRSTGVHRECALRRWYTRHFGCMVEDRPNLIPNRSCVKNLCTCVTYFER